MSLSTDERYLEAETSEEQDTDIKQVFFKYLAYWKWFVLSFVLLLLLGRGYLFTITPQYQIQARILIKDQKNGTEAMSMLEELDMFSSKKIVENEIEILRSYTLLEEVARNMNLQVQYMVKDGILKKELYGNVPVQMEVVFPTDELYGTPLLLHLENGQIWMNGQQYPPNRIITEHFGSIRFIPNDSLIRHWDAAKDVEITVKPMDGIVENLRGNLNVDLSAKGTSVINLSLLTSVPQKGKDILNQLIAVYNKAAIADKNNLAGITLKFIDKRLELLASDLRKAEQDVETYKLRQGITDISTEAHLFLQSVRENDMESNKVNIQADVLKNIEQYVLSDETSGTTPATLGLSDPTLLSLISLLTAAEAERSTALHTMGSDNPKIQALNDQVISLKNNIMDNIQVLQRSLEITHNNLKTEAGRIESMIQSIPKKERELVEMTRQKTIKEQLYLYLLSKREETDISYASTVSDSRLIDAARATSRAPVKPQKKIVLLAFGLIGLLIPAGVLWLIDLFDDKVNTKEIVEKQIRIPLVGEISFVEQANKLISANSRTKYAEQFRTLRTNLEFMQAGRGVKTVLVTSSVSGEGKSFISANLAISLAALGKKVVALGFDLRKPGLHTVFGLDNDEGLSNYLAGQATLPQIIRKTGAAEYPDVITCGRIPPNPQELLQGAALPQLFDELDEIYDYIIIDTPPVGVVSDALIIGRHAGVALYIVRQNYTPKDRIKSINDLSATKKLQNAGVVINGIKEEKWYGYYHSYGSYKYYGEYYDEEKRRKRRRQSVHS
ncbi:MAG: polysaccharide biosynthesis tyrosine autokinase [Bacteroidales bacterium]|jgi:capsular exopolysaccharide synthesis family protein|nr:polysaccharide biosynthesis tyrosine autokinase [Bacteroidales bacterium]